MITEEEKQEIIDRAVEKTLLHIPKVVGNLIVQQAQLAKSVEQFYDANKDLVEHKETVARVMEEEGNLNPGAKYDELVQKALPKIRRRIKEIAPLNLKDLKKPDEDDLSMNGRL